jgi:hypothetical protein
MEEFKEYNGGMTNPTPVIMLTLLINKQRLEKVTGADGFESRKFVTYTEQLPVTICADNVLYPRFLLERKPTGALCNSPAKCHHAHHDGRTHGNLCARALKGLECPADCTFVHTVEFPKKDGTSATGASSASGGARGSKPMESKMMCWKWLMQHLGLNAPKCDGCGYAHSFESQAKPAHFDEFVKRLTSGTLVTQTQMDEVMRVIISAATSEGPEHDAVMEMCSNGKLPPFSRSAASHWFRIWFRAANKLRSGSDKTALALFSAPGGLEETMVWQTVRHFHTCHTSQEMASKKIFGLTNNKVVPPSSKTLTAGSISVCQGGCSCWHGAHFSTSTGVAHMQLDEDNFNGITTSSKQVEDPASIIKEHTTKLAHMQEVKKLLNEKGVSSHRKVEAMADYKQLQLQLAAIRDRYFQTYPKTPVFKSADNIVLKAPEATEAVINMVITPTDFSVDLPPVIPSGPMTEEERAHYEQLELAYRARLQAKLQEQEAKVQEQKRIIKEKQDYLTKMAATAATINSLRTMPDADALTAARSELLDLFYDFKDATPVNGIKFSVFSITGKRIIYTKDSEWFVPAPGGLSLVKADSSMILAPVKEAIDAVTAEAYASFTASGASKELTFWTYIKPSTREIWDNFSTSGTQLSWDAFCQDVSNKRDTWDNLGVIRYSYSKGKDTSKKGKKRQNTHEEDDAELIEEVIIDINCPEKKMYANFWDFYFARPKTDIRAGFVGSPWGSKLAVAEPVLFEQFLNASATSQDLFDGSFKHTQLAAKDPERYPAFVAALQAHGYTVCCNHSDQNRADFMLPGPNKLTFDRWILESFTRSAAYAVYTSNKGTSWRTATRYANVIKANITGLTLEKFTEREYDIMSYIYSAASKNVGIEHGGVTLDTFLTAPADYLDFYSTPAFTIKTFAQHTSDRAEGWKTVGKFRRLAEALRALPSFTWADPSLIKSILKAVGSIAPIVAKITTVEEMVEQIYNSGAMPLGAKLSFTHKDTAYTVVTSLFDGIFIQLLQEMARSQPNATQIKALLQLLPSTDAAAMETRDQVVALLQAKHQDQMSAVEAEKAEILGSKPRDFKAKRTTKEAALRQNEAKMSALRAINLSAMLHKCLLPPPASGLALIFRPLPSSSAPWTLLLVQMPPPPCPPRSRLLPACPRRRLCLRLPRPTSWQTSKAIPRLSW